MIEPLYVPKVQYNNLVFYLLLIIHGDNWVKWPERESDHKPLYNVELTCGDTILRLCMNVQSI